MKYLAIAILVFCQFFMLSKASGQVDLDSILNLPEKDRAAALLTLAKESYNSNLELADEYSYKAMLIAEKLDQTNEMGLAKKYLGITAHYRRNYLQALDFYKDAKLLFESNNNRKEEANVINNIAVIYDLQGQYDTSILYYEKSLQIRENLNDAKGIIGSLTNIGNLHNALGDYNKSLEYYLKAMDISMLVFPEQQFPTLLSSMAKCFASLGNTTEAVTYYQRAITAAIENKNIPTEISSRINLGNVYYELGSTSQAITCMSEALDIAHTNQMEYYEAVITLNIGNVYLQMERYSQAAKLYKSALAVYQKTNDNEGRVNALINIALTDEKLNLPDSARIRFLQAREISEQLYSPHFLAITANHLGAHYLQNKNFNQAYYWLETALKITELNNSIQENYTANYNMGLYWSAKNINHKAIEFLKKALQQANFFKSIVLQRDAAESLWRAYKETDQLKLALETLELYTVLNDSILNEEKQKQILALEGKLNLKIKENQIDSQEKIIAQQKKILKQEKYNKIYIIIVAVLLIGLLVIVFSREQNRRQKEKAILLQQNLTTERDLLQLQMNPHFIFNALNSIQSFISENNSFEAEMFLSKFARLMRYYLDSSSKKWIDFTDEIQAIELNLELERLRLNNKFEFTIKVDENIEAEASQIPPMLLQPFIENAIKHGLRPKEFGGLLEVGFKKHKDFLFCYVEDNGVGREESAKLKGNKPGHQSKGVELTRRRLAAFTTKDSSKIMLYVIDLQGDNGQPLGTRVELYVPFRYF